MIQVSAVGVDVEGKLIVWCWEVVWCMLGLVRAKRGILGYNVMYRPASMFMKLYHIRVTLLCRDM